MMVKEKRCISELLVALREHSRTNARTHLPWRNTRDPYHILVSEIMLQQTQVERMIPFYENFLREFPNVAALAGASRADVLRAWQGLGYNRRAKFLHEAAQAVMHDWGGVLPRTAGELEQLPGVGPYTARAIAAFAHNSPEVFIETNIRTVFFHHCFARSRTPVSDKQLLPLVAAALAQSSMHPRDFYAALMDYGSHLKRSGVRLNKKSAHHTPQSKFEGSGRQLRGGIIRELLVRPATPQALAKTLARTLAEVVAVLAALQKEKLVQKIGRTYSTAE